MPFLKKSYSLVEVILAITIMGILAAIVLPRFGKAGFSGSLTLRAATSQIASDIRYTRQLAITKAIRHYIKLNFSTKEYAIYNDNNIQISETKKIPSAVACSGTSQFDFSSIGACTLGGGTYLSLSSGTNQNRITAETPTGAVVVEKIP